MACSFSVQFSGTPDDFKQKVEGLLQGHGEMSGDTKSGTFTVNVPAGKIKGSYNVSGNTVAVGINDKPFFLPCGVIESFAKSHI